jgi:hypothetical protein
MDGQGALDDFKEILGKILEKDGSGNYIYSTLEGHNAASFDVDKLVGTMQRLEAYGKDPKAQELLKEFLTRKQTDYKFFVDTLDSASIYMSGQSAEMQEHLSKIAGLSQDTIDEIVTSFAISSENYGGAAGPESLENLFLNTNFFSLLDQEKLSPEVVKMLQERGSHTSDVDATLNAYLSHYMQTGKLKRQQMPLQDGEVPRNLSEQAAANFKDKSSQIQKILQEKGFIRKDRTVSAFETFMRRRIARSSSATPITNVRDMKGLSENVFKYLSQNPEGQERISLQVNPDTIDRLGQNKIDLGIGRQTGSVYYDEGFKFNGPNGIQNLNETQARNAIEHITEQARNGPNQDFNVGKFNIKANPYAEDISNISLLELEATQIDRSFAARQAVGTVRPDLSRSAKELQETLRITTDTYGEHVKDSTGQISKKITYNPPLVGEKIINAAGQSIEKTTDYSRRVFEAGLPYAGMEPAARASAVNQSRNSFPIGRKIYSTLSQEQGHTPENAALYADIARNTDNEVFHEIGLQHVMAQGKEDVFGMVRMVGNEPKKIGRNTYFRTPVNNIEGTNSKIIMNADDLSKIQIPQTDGSSLRVLSDEFYSHHDYNRLEPSSVKSAADESSIINQFWKPKNLTSEQNESIAEQILALQSKRHNELALDSSRYVSNTTRGEIAQLRKNIFDDHIDSVKLFENFSTLETRNEREQFLKQTGIAHNVGDNYYSAYQREIENISEKFQERRNCSF